MQINATPPYYPNKLPVFKKNDKMANKHQYFAGLMYKKENDMLFNRQEAKNSKGE